MPSSTLRGNSSCIFENNCFWVSKDEKNSSLTFKFTKKKFVLTKYVLTVANEMCSPQEWVIEGYNFNNNVYQISYKKELMCTNRHVNSNNNQVCYANSPTQHIIDQTFPFRFIRLRQIDVRDCSVSPNVLPLSKIVFQGYFSIECTHCKQRRNNCHSLFIIFLLT